MESLQNQNNIENTDVSLEEENMILKERIKELEKENSDLRFEKKVLEKESIIDKQTGLKNKAFFYEFVSEQLRQIKESKEGYHPERRKGGEGLEEICIIVCDIDNFKKVNDTEGHIFGDEVLQEVADVFRSSVRKGDIAARWGGEEIAVSLAGASKKDALIKAEEIRKKIEGLEFSKPGFKITASFGVASSQDELDLMKLFERADEVMYKAKKSGKNRTIVSLTDVD